MKLIVTAVLFALLLAGLWVLARVLESKKRQRPRHESDAAPTADHLLFIRADAVLTANEAEFYRHLVMAVGGKFLVFPQLPVSLIVQPDASMPAGARQAAMNKIDRKRVDFALVDAATMRVAMAVEVNDASHRRPSRQERDEFVSRSLAQAGVRLVTIRASRTYSADELARSLALSPSA